MSFVRNFVPVISALLFCGFSGSAFAAARACEGSFRINATGYTGQMDLTARRGNQIAGAIRWDDTRFGVSQISGTCDVAARHGQIAFFRPDANQSFTGTVTVDARLGTTMVGTLLYGNRAYPWSATELVQAGDRACNGTFRINAVGYTGEMRLVGGRQNLAGQIIWDDARFGVSQISGSCTFDRRSGLGSIQFYRPDAAQSFSGTLSDNGVTVTMSGTFLYGNRTYGWSAVSYDTFPVIREVR